MRVHEPREDDAANPLDGDPRVPREDLAAPPDVHDCPLARRATTAPSRMARRVTGDDRVGVDGAHAGPQAGGVSQS